MISWLVFFSTPPACANLPSASRILSDSDLVVVGKGHCEETAASVNLLLVKLGLRLVSLLGCSHFYQSLHLVLLDKGGDAQDCQEEQWQKKEEREH